MDELPIYPGLLNATRVYSPITLSREWPTLARLVGVVFASCFGATLNGYFISAFFVDQDLRRLGNVYHACMGLADMLITGIVMPMSAVVLLSGVWDLSPVCHVLQTLVACSTYCYSMYFPFVSGEIYFRVCWGQNKFKKSNARICVTVIAILVFLIGITLAASGTYLELDYDYCERRHFGSNYFRMSTSCFVHGTSFFCTMYTLTASYIHVRSEEQVHPRFRKSIHHYRDAAMIRLNFLAYILYVAFWVPYLVIVNVFPSICDAWYYQTAWAGVCRPLFTSMLYGSLNHHFGRAYSNIFNYCCCKSSINNCPRHQRRAIEYRGRPVIADVRTHIMQQAVNAPQRASSATRDAMEL